MPTASGPIVLVGAGKMGGSMLEGWLAAGLGPSRVVVIDPKPGEAVTKHEVRLASSADELEGWAGTLVIAVKPDMVDSLLPTLRPLARPHTIVLSVVAGVTVSRLAAAFADGQPIIRTMPNTPAQVGQGMTVAVANEHVDREAVRAVDDLLSHMGRTAWIDDESLMDAVTAVSGSGPAYVFLLAECLAKAGAKVGLPDDLAELLARQTVAGAGVLMAGSDVAAAQLRENVTSPGGTTAAALSVLMDEPGLQGILDAAVAAARDRSRALGRSA